VSATPAQVNGTKRLAVPVYEGWQSFPIINGVIQNEQTAPEVAAPAALVPAVDPRAEAEADAIRAQTAAAIEAARIEAEAKAEAIRAKAEAEAERLRLANERNRMALEEKQAAHARKLAELQAEQEEIDRQAAAARKKADDEATAEAEEQRKQQEAEAATLAEIAAADDKWRKYAIRFAFICGIVSLPVQMSFFWNPRAPWMAAAPVMLEGAAWVVHRGARAAVANRRPVWHYRTIVWLLAFVAAGVNLYHGLHSFDPGTALATAFASIAGPGVWDLHEHGRIRKRAGVLTRRERKAQQAATKRVAAEKAAEKRFAAEREAYIEHAEREAVAKLATDREEHFPEVWEHALKLAAALGETPVSEATWRRAWFDTNGAEPGEELDTVRNRRAAVTRMEKALGEAPANTPSKVTNAQRSSHLSPSQTKPRTSPRPKPIPPRRTRGDSAPFHPIAKRAQAVDVRRRLATENASNTDQN
jgi:chemotaxis protein histidine kinase CheA